MALWRNVYAYPGCAGNRVRLRANTELLRLSREDICSQIELVAKVLNLFFFSSRRRHTRFDCDSSDVCSSDLLQPTNSSDPRPKTRCCLRIAISRFIQLRSENGYRSCASTLIA